MKEFKWTGKKEQDETSESGQSKGNDTGPRSLLDSGILVRILGSEKGGHGNR